MPGPHKGVSTQCTNQQVMAKPRHQPLERDQQAKIKSVHIYSYEKKYYKLYIRHSNPMYQ